jgi:hypothetical protein
MGNFITLDIELKPIRSFLKTVLDAVDSEYLRIKEKSDAGEYKHFEDKGNALYTPMMWEEIAFRAVLGELNALVEWELQILASKNDKSLKEKPGKSVFELKFSDIIKLIERNYKIKITEVESYIAIKRIREKINSFKHRKGFKKPLQGGAITLDKFTVDRKEAFQNIESVRSFLRDLWSKTKDN